MKKIGILGGISHYSTIEYYRRIIDLYNSMYNSIDYPEIIIYSLSFGRFKKLEDLHNTDEYLDYISQGITGLISSGAGIVALAANSPHSMIKELRDKFDIPIINAIDSAFNEAERLKIKKGLLLGIKFTMQSSFYQDRFKQGSIDLITPNLHEQEIIHDIILHRLVYGQAIDAITSNELLKVISNYEVDGVILGCMRLPIFFNNQTIEGLNLVNTLDKHIEDILNMAIE